MNQAGRGCHSGPPPSGDAGGQPLAVASPVLDLISGDLIPTVMLYADWRALSALVWSSSPGIWRRSQPLVVLEDESGRLVVEPTLYVLPELNSAPLAKPRVEANATWG